MYAPVLLLTVFAGLSGVIRLPAPDTSGGASLAHALAERRSMRSFSETDSLSLAQLSQLLWAAQGKTGTRGRRTAPSAGATYPLGLLCVIQRVSGAEPGLYEYQAVENTLMPMPSPPELVPGLAGACLGQSWMGRAAAILIIVADYSRTTDHYGDRGIRYVDMEAGHAGQNIYLQATALGLGTCAVGAFRDLSVAALLGLVDVTPLYIFPVGVPE